jgi:hypothetical protein
MMGYLIKEISNSDVFIKSKNNISEKVLSKKDKKDLINTLVEFKGILNSFLNSPYRRMGYSPVNNY